MPLMNSYIRTLIKICGIRISFFLHSAGLKDDDLLFFFQLKDNRKTFVLSPDSQAHWGLFHQTSHWRFSGPFCVSTINYFRRRSGPQLPWILPYNPQHLFYVQCWPMWESASIGCQHQHRWAHILTERQLALWFQLNTPDISEALV